ncbi:uncharacterized protein GGS25DRAFT_474306 [Hypoxylon fragiforme]|uniref:uncharacterized protein n=1 Tax=Hypoxylon fragiforme TaxID=63214 RepID=UPI0020C5D348|nr:uncharacterized protein GGS25DRAFT_474306 [Hypoxylon fragiforme]KAI2612209.1 hypothetical protein GGS25DRAFT_474306 [Hypoxylon fragiforme]
MDGTEHQVHRKMLSGSFSLQNVRKLEPVFQAKTRDLSRYFDKCIREGNDGNTGVVDCTPTFSKATLDIMGSIILGIDLNHVKPDENGSDHDLHGHVSTVKYLVRKYRFIGITQSFTVENPSLTFRPVGLTSKYLL